ncbi:hypothetical protein [Brevundimonas sp.]|uniref:hypothetical protein n=1 Tax=Brevundimonas sp. TaxID=1871086 RepID=UPI0025F9621A|nr:hypothetical protein [Brevundimonas sp.]
MKRLLTASAAAAALIGLGACDGGEADRKTTADSAGESATAAEPGTPAAMERQAAIADAPDDPQGAPGLEINEYVEDGEAAATTGADASYRGDDDPAS